MRRGGVNRCCDRFDTAGRRPDRCPQGGLDVPEGVRAGELPAPSWLRSPALPDEADVCSAQIVGLMLNQSHFICPSCSSSHELFGSPASFRATAARFGVDVLGELPLVPGVSRASDAGIAYALYPKDDGEAQHHGGKQWLETMASAASQVWQFLAKQ